MFSPRRGTNHGAPRALDTWSRMVVAKAPSTAPRTSAGAFAAMADGASHRAVCRIWRTRRASANAARWRRDGCAQSCALDVFESRSDARNGRDGYRASRIDEIRRLTQHRARMASWANLGLFASVLVPLAAPRFCSVFWLYRPQIGPVGYADISVDSSTSLEYIRPSSAATY